ncbi:MAG: hypothetical protein U0795_07310 [Pirellulales bacterium]
MTNRTPQITRHWILACVLGLLPLAKPIMAATDQELVAAIAALQSVANEGQHHAEAQQAWQKLRQAEAVQLPVLLQGLKPKAPLGNNWLRAAIDAVAEQTLAAGRPLPKEQLEAFVRDRDRVPQARRLAYEWLIKADPSAEERLIPGMVDDPSLELRRDAVARLLKQAEQSATDSKNDAAQQTFQAALVAARDQDQIEAAAAGLEKLGVKVDLPRHYGFITDWQIIGPFDNRNKVGFDAIYAPEKEIKPDGSYPGKEVQVSWKAYHTDDKFGLVDLNQGLGKNMGAVGYAYAEFYSDTDRPADIRLGCINANKVWFNGQPIIANHVYHAGTAIDQYVAQVELKSGKNTILVKCLQNEQTESWAQDWRFQLRVCDAIGTAILSQKE